MDYGVLNSLTLIFLAAGLTLYLTSRSLARRAKSYQAGMQSLLQLGAQGLVRLPGRVRMGKKTRAAT